MTSILGGIAAARKGTKNQQYTSIKTKLPEQYRTKNLTCALCGRKYARRKPISENEVRILCESCLMQNRRRDDKYPVEFRRASNL
jgi:hypothetical protein